MKRVFADTFYWLAVANPADQWHDAAIEATDRLHPMHLVTTDEVLAEFLAGMAGTGDYHRRRAVRIVRDILADDDMTVLPQTRESFLAGLDLYEQHADKGYSLTDCISMNACRAESITEVFTNDHHLTQDGFTILIHR